MVSNTYRAGLLGSLLAALVLSGCASSGGYSSNDKPLSGTEIVAVLVGNSVSGDNWDGPFTAYFPTFGEVVGVRATHYRDKGTWRVEEDALCVQWEDWWGGVERCWGIYLDGTYITWRRPDSEKMERARLREGNPAGL